MQTLIASRSSFPAYPDGDPQASHTVQPCTPDLSRGGPLGAVRRAGDSFATFLRPNLDLRRATAVRGPRDTAAMQSKNPFAPHTEPGSAGTDRLAPVIRLRPIRMLVISPDLAYRERAWTVLSELGPVSATVVSLADADDIAGLLHEEGADVLLLDATGRETAARELIQTLARTAPRTGIVVVCHHCTEAARELRALPKWGWTQDLRAGVEHAYGTGNPLAPVTLSPLRRSSTWQRMAGPLLRRGG